MSLFIFAFVPRSITFRGIHDICPFLFPSVFTFNYNLLQTCNSEGIDVYDHEGKSVGKSQKAGMSAITQVAISRVLTNFPVLTIPPLVLSQWERTSWAQQYPKAVIPINLAVISLVLMSALPLAIAAFPQYANVDVNTLEERFWNLKDSKGKPIKTLTYNKGL
jgi:hypothetical protein